MTRYAVRLVHMDSGEERVVLVEADAPVTAMSQALNENFQRDPAWRKATAVTATEVTEPEKAKA